MASTFFQFNIESFLLKPADFQMVYPQSMKISQKILVQIQAQKLKLPVIILVPISMQIPLKLLKMDLFRQKLKLWQWSLAHPFYCFWLNKVSAPKKCCISQFTQFMKKTPSEIRAKDSLKIHSWSHPGVNQDMICILIEFNSPLAIWILVK